MNVEFRQTNQGVRVWRVLFTVRGRGTQDRDLVLKAAVEHYGKPALDQPAWCPLDEQGRACRTDEPVLVFEPADGAAGRFILSAPSR